MSDKNPEDLLPKGTVDFAALSADRSDKRRRKLIWLQAFIDTGSLDEANTAAGISRQTSWEYRKDASFRELITQVYEDISRHTLTKFLQLTECGDPAVELRATKEVQDRVDALAGHLPANAREQVNLVVIMQQLAQNPIGARILGLNNLADAHTPDGEDAAARED